MPTPRDLDLKPVLKLGLDLDQYFGLWAIDDGRFLAQWERIAQMNLLAHVELHQEGQASMPEAAISRAKVDDTRSIVVIDIEGTMTKRGSSLSEAGSTIAIRKAIRQAGRDPGIAAIVLRIDSPGGTVAGTADLARDVMATREQKPVWAFIEDLAASAAYWPASQAERVFANDDTALVGSIGTYVGTYDYSALAGQEGIRPVLIKAGKFKGAGFPGTEITEDQKRYWQEIVDQTQAVFTGAIAAGRKMSLPEAEALVEGRVWTAPEALSRNLIDGIQTFDETIVQLQQQLKTTSQPRRKARTRTMTNESNTSDAASFEDIKACCPGADAEFICAQQEKKATLDQAQSAWMEEQNRQVQAADKRAKEAEEKTQAAAKEAEEKAQAAATRRPGVKVEGDRDSGGGSEEASGDAVEAFDAAVQKAMTLGLSRDQAVVRVATRDKALHQAYLLATNEGPRAQRLITEKMNLGE